MRKVIMYCDRCKKEFKKWNHKRIELIGVGEIIYDNDDPYLDRQKDLCESCYTELEKWWNFDFDSQAESEDETSYTPEEVRNILIEEGQEHGSAYGLKLGDIIKFSPTEVEQILKAESEVQDADSN